MIIDVTDVNEYEPTFAEGVMEVDIEEEVPTGSSVDTVQVYFIKWCWYCISEFMWTLRFGMVEVHYEE